MMNEIEITEDNIKEFVEEVYDLNLQNLNDRLSEIECFKEGIEVGIRDLLEKQNVSEPTEKPNTSEVNLPIKRVSDLLIAYTKERLGVNWKAFEKWETEKIKKYVEGNL